MMEFNFKVTPNAEALFNNGEEFQKAAARCLGVNKDGAIEIAKDGVFITLPAPAVVNAAFACEMYLKALILKSGKNYPTNRDGHNLKKLYDMLLEPIQKHIYQFCVNKEDCAEIIFTSFLENHSRDFMEARYYVTKEGWQGMSPIAVYTYAFNLRNITKYLLSNWETVVNG